MYLNRCVLCVVQLFAFFLVGVAHCAELTVLSSVGVKPILETLAPQIERELGFHLSLEFDSASALKRKIDGGAKFDVAILTDALIEELVTQRVVVKVLRREIARVGIGVAARSGDSKSTIKSVADFKQLILKAGSIAYAKDGASGTRLIHVVESLGLSAVLDAKGRPVAARDVMALVADGRAEIGVQLVSEILSAPGVELVAPLPPAIQSSTVFVAAASAYSQQLPAAAKLIAYLRSAVALSIVRAKGMEP